MSFGIELIDASLKSWGNFHALCSLLTNVCPYAWTLSNNMQSTEAIDCIELLCGGRSWDPGEK
jgi:hypothetical protein